MGGVLTLQVRGQQRDGVLGKGSLGMGQRQQQQQQQQGHGVGGRGHPVRGSSSPRGYPLTHMLALKGETEKWGEGLSSLCPCRRQTPPQVYPQKTLWGGAKNRLRLTPSQLSLVTQGPSLANWPELVSGKPAGVTPGKDRTDPLPHPPAFPPLSRLAVGHSVGDTSRPLSC